MELTLLEILADALDGTKDWRKMETKELASILEERVEGRLGYEDEEDFEDGEEVLDEY